MSFYELRRRGVLFLHSTLLSCPHGFSTRTGGVSTLPHLASMNFGEGRGDSAENIAENFQRFCAAAELPHRVAAAKQVHSAAVRTLTEEEIAALPEIGEDLPSLDGFMTACRGVTLCVKTADCLPILLYEKEANVVCALHAGWRGSAGGISLRGVEAMEKAGAKPDRIFCTIGPSIHACCYQVQEDFAGEFRSLLGSAFAEKFLHPRPDGSYDADLQGLNRHLLLEAGVPRENIDISPECTCCTPDAHRFFSHRASHGLRGTMAAMISLGEEPPDRF